MLKGFGHYQVYAEPAFSVSLVELWPVFSHDQGIDRQNLRFAMESQLEPVL